MNTRICAVVATVTLLTLTSGCSGMRNFLFGRGARCGMCNQPSGPAPAADCGSYGPQAPANQNFAAPGNAGCGCNNGGMYAGQIGNGGYGSAYSGGCGCGGINSGYATDPYQTNEYMGTMPYEGQIIDYGVVDGTVVGNGTVSPDNFAPRSGQ